MFKKILVKYFQVRLILKIRIKLARYFYQNLVHQKFNFEEINPIFFVSFLINLFYFG